MESFERAHGEQRHGGWCARVFTLYVSPSVVLIAKNIYMIIGSSLLTSPTAPPVDYTPELTMLSLRNHDCLHGNWWFHKLRIKTTGEQGWCVHKQQSSCVHINSPSKQENINTKHYTHTHTYTEQVGWNSMRSSWFNRMVFQSCELSLMPQGEDISSYLCIWFYQTQIFAFSDKRDCHIWAKGIQL